MSSHFAVLGAGAFGGWTALHLLRAGHRVTLIDAWGPGHSRSSSGDETRVIRAGYGPNLTYTRLTARALTLWRDLDRFCETNLFRQTGVLWFSSIRNDAWDLPALAALQQAQLPFDVLSPAEAAHRFPIVNFDDIVTAVYEHHAGYLFARRACQTVCRMFVAEGGHYRQAHAALERIEANRLPGFRLSDGSLLQADTYVVAPGPWFRDLFPEFPHAVTPTRQDVFYFATPPGDARFDDSRFPAWIDNSPTRFYGIPSNEHRGFKVAIDVPGPEFDPTNGDRHPSPDALARYRAFLAHRFPSLKDAPVAEFRVCQYEMTADGHLIAGFHPEAANLFLLAGGSGHSFKFSPALGELAAQCILHQHPIPSEFLLSRLHGAKGIGERK